MALPLLHNVPPAERLELFARKLHFCCKCYDFTREDESVKEKEIKRVYLNEVADYIETTKGVLQQEPVYAISIVMIGRNIFRYFPSKDPSYDPEEDDPITEAAWPHLGLVYNYFLHFVCHPDFQPSIAKKCMDNRFITRLLYTFGSYDLRERESLKAILHQIYGKFLGLRSCIRKVVNNIFLSHIYEDIVFDGLCEILEVFGSIINGYVTPLKTEHLTFLHKILMPLHVSKSFVDIQPQLVYCIVQYMEKEPSLTSSIVQGLLRYWPKTSCQKEVLFLGELEELIDGMQPSEFQKLQNLILQRISQCTKSLHFQVSERALYIWDNEYVLSLVEVNADITYPIVIPSLTKASKLHWNESIRNISATVKKTLKESNSETYNKVCRSEKKLPVPKTKGPEKKMNLWRKAISLTRNRKSSS